MRLVVVFTIWKHLMKVGDLVKLLKDDVRGRNGYPGKPVILAGAVGMIVPDAFRLPNAELQDCQRDVKLLTGETRRFLARDLETISESR